MAKIVSIIGFVMFVVVMFIPSNPDMLGLARDDIGFATLESTEGNTVFVFILMAILVMVSTFFKGMKLHQGGIVVGLGHIIYAFIIIMRYNAEFHLLQIGWLVSTIVLLLGPILALTKSFSQNKQ